jgi:hypothetical protein
VDYAGGEESDDEEEGARLVQKEILGKPRPEVETHEELSKVWHRANCPDAMHLFAANYRFHEQLAA